jgi:hypothetical protein
MQDSYGGVEIIELSTGDPDLSGVMIWSILS